MPAFANCLDESGEDDQGTLQYDWTKYFTDLINGSSSNKIQDFNNFWNLIESRYTKENQKDDDESEKWYGIIHVKKQIASLDCYVNIQTMGMDLYNFEAQNLSVRETRMVTALPRSKKKKENDDEEPI